MAWLEKCHCGKKHRVEVTGKCPHCGCETFRPVSQKVAGECGDYLCGLCEAAQDALR